MGLIKTIMRAVELKKMLKEDDYFFKMTREELEHLNDSDFVCAIGDRLDRQEDAYENMESYSETQRVFIAADCFECSAVGGIKDYLSGQYKSTIAYVLMSLEVIGAYEYKELLENYVNEKRIDLSNIYGWLENNNIDDDEYYEYALFDEKYAQLEKRKKLEEYISAYARKHIDELLM